MKRREFVRNVAYGGLGLAGAAALYPLLSGCARDGAAQRPNVLVIFADDMGFSDIGCYGGEIDTPHIDGLAEGGIRFSQFYNTARCCPSRASLLTGLYPHQAGLGHLTTSAIEDPAYQGYLNDQCVTAGEALQQAGYRTLMTGKWHVGYAEPDYWPSSRGFDRFYGEHRYVDDYFKPTHQLYLNGEPVEPEGPDWYSTDAYTDYALQFMDEAHQDERPFFLYVAYNAPHFPLQAFQEDVEKYRGRFMEGWDVLRQRRYERQVDMGLIDERWSLSPREMSPHEHPVPAWEDVEDKELWDHKMAAYAAQVDRMDQNIGRLLDQLETMGVANNTLVLFLSDNGGCAEAWIDRQNPEGVLPGARNCKLAYGLPWANLSNTPFRMYKRWVHEGGIATPLIAYWPGVIDGGGAISHEPGHVIDILPTCLDAAGADYPQTYAGRDVLPVEGESLVPLLQGGSTLNRKALFFEHEGNEAVRMGKWKLVQRDRFIDGAWELYDLAVDRTETNDLSDQYPEKVEELAAAYQRWADRTGVIPWEERPTG